MTGLQQHYRAKIRFFLRLTKLQYINKYGTYYLCTYVGHVGYKSYMTSSLHEGGRQVMGKKK